MNYDELYAALQKVCKEADKEFDIFISIINTDTGDGGCCGVGCPACHVHDVIRVRYLQGAYKHSAEILNDGPSGKTH